MIARALALLNCRCGVFFFCKLTPTFALFFFPMALVILCGFPAAGKSAFAAALSDNISAAGRPVTTVSDGGVVRHAGASTPALTPRATRAELYASAWSEKRVRAELRAAAERALHGPQSVVIVDSLNYVGGFRYELSCAARTHGAACVLVHVGVDIDATDCIARDATREDGYGEALVRALIARFEAPDGRRRWDIALRDQVQAVTDAVLGASPGVAPRATRTMARPHTDALAALDRATRGAEAALLAQIREGAGIGAHVRLPGATKAIILGRICRASELRNMRKAILSLARMHPPEDTSEESVMNGYVDYVNAQLMG